MHYEALFPSTRCRSGSVVRWLLIQSHMTAARMTFTRMTTEVITGEQSLRAGSSATKIAAQYDTAMKASFSIPRVRLSSTMAPQPIQRKQNARTESISRNCIFYLLRLSRKEGGTTVIIIYQFTILSMLINMAKNIVKLAVW